MVEYVFDVEPLIAFFYGEPGHEALAELLDEIGRGDAEGALAEVNASELLYKIARIEGDDGTATSTSLRAADRDVRALERRGLAIERADWRLASEVKAAGGVSLADAHAVALAHDRDATLVAGGDDAFDALPVDVDLWRFRDHGV